MARERQDIEPIMGRMFNIEMSKNGTQISNKSMHEMTRSDLLAERNNVRRTLENLGARAEKEISKNDTNGSDKTLALIDAGRSIVNNIQVQLDHLDECDNLVRNHATPNTLTSASGNRIHLLNSTDRFADLTRDAQQVEYGLGEYLANMVGRGNNQSIRNDLAEGSDATGGATVPARLVGQVIDKMRANMVTIKAGAKTLALDTNVTKVARLTTDPTASWRLEAGAVSSSDPAFDTVTFTRQSLTQMS